MESFDLTGPANVHIVALSGSSRRKNVSNIAACGGTSHVPLLSYS